MTDLIYILKFLLVKSKKEWCLVHVADCVGNNFAFFLCMCKCRVGVGNFSNQFRMAVLYAYGIDVWKLFQPMHTFILLLRVLKTPGIYSHTKKDRDRGQNKTRARISGGLTPLDVFQGLPLLSSESLPHTRSSGSTSRRLRQLPRAPLYMKASRDDYFVYKIGK